MPPQSWFKGLASPEATGAGWPALAEPQGIGYTAFVATMLDDIQISSDTRLCRAVFDLLDAGRDGFLCPSDLHQRLGLSSREAQQVVSEAIAQLQDSAEHTNIDSQHLSFEAFLTFMRTPVAMRKTTPYAGAVTSAVIDAPFLGFVQRLSSPARQYLAQRLGN
jgi:hypothetical protein